jgi:EAL domain-containing protein (putative c-di-GMP-specific phosphodiesterase class I)
MVRRDGSPLASDSHRVRARRTAALTRTAMGVAGFVLLLLDPTLLPVAAYGLVGFALIGLTSMLQLVAPRLSWFGAEESLSAASGVLIVGLGSERVTVLSVLWLVAVASGVLARGGRQHWLGRTIVLAALLLPVARYGQLTSEYAAFLVATIGLLLASGRMTFELNELLGQARLQADSAETLLLAGDIASRMAEREERAEAETARTGVPAHPHLSPQEAASAADALARVLRGEGLAMVVQPIVDVTSGVVHAYEALARFGGTGAEASPLHWFSLAQELGERPALERACLRLALELFRRRPPGTSLSVNLSTPVLLDDRTQEMLREAGEGEGDDLHGLIVEITEETLVQGDMELLAAFDPLRRRGARLAVDDVGAGYSGLRQITSVRPSYLKLDRSLVTGIEADGERAALVGALAGYSSQVGCLLVAEGIETVAELDAVRDLGATLGQGFLLARPGPPWPVVSDALARPKVTTPALESIAGTGIVEALHPVA